MKRFVVGRNSDTGKTVGIVTSYSADHIEYCEGRWQPSYVPIMSQRASRLIKEFEEVPCGQCFGCRLSYSRQWANRLMMELEYHDSAYFVTLTYDELHAPTNFYPDPDTGEAIPVLTLCVDDIQRWMKRLRKAFPDDHIRYYLAGEYGPETFRPHYHAIVFGLHLPDLVPWKRSTQGFQYFNSPSLQRTWSVKDSKGSYAPLGYAVVAPVTWETCAYTARYVTKKLTGDAAVFYDTYNIIPEFSVMSRHPGIAKQWYLDHPDLFDYDYINLRTDKGGLKFRPPKYFQNLYDLDCPEESAELKLQRRKLAEQARSAKLRDTSLSYLELLQVEESNLVARTKSLERNDI